MEKRKKLQAKIVSASNDKFVIRIGDISKTPKVGDVVIDSALVEPLEKETVILALGQETPEEWAANMDEYVKNQK